jgi:phosphohistidine phosphatase
MKRLMLMRHAKSDWDAAYATDHDRPLSRRGRESAVVMGIVLARAGLAPDLAISSSAVRARTTVELAAEAGSWNATIEISPALYGTSPHAALDVASRSADGVDSLMLVGHEPTWSGLVHHLTGARVNVKTATVVGIELPGDTWRRVGDAQGALEFVLQPRMFAEGWELT